MESLQAYIDEYQKQLERGAIQKAYQGLMAYIQQLRTLFKNKYPDYFVSGTIYYGYMDMTYFAFTPKSLKDRGLKIAIVFIHEGNRFEAWLAGNNKQIQLKYWQIFKDSDWISYPLVATTEGADAIVEHVVVQHPNFDHLEALTAQIETGTLKFIQDIEGLLSQH